MAIEIINVGTSANDGNGDPIRDAFIKCNDNFDELETTKISGSGTDNYVPKFNGTDAIENSQIFDNGTNVGIGTNTPSSTLQVGNGIGIKNIFISGAGSSLALGGLSVSFLGFSSGTISTINTSGSVPLGVGTRSTQPLVLGTNNAEIMRIDSSGNVGIGTTVPATKLDITDVFRVQSSSFSSPSTGIGLELRSVSGTSSLLSYDRTNSLYKPLVLDGSDILIKYSGNNGIYLNSTGNVGIGTTSPSKKLTLIDNSTYQLRLASTNSAYSDAGIFMGSDISDPYYYGTIKWDQGAQAVKISSNSASGIGGITFETSPNTSAPTERMRITSSGNVGIGLTNPDNGKLTILKNSSYATESSYGIAIQSNASNAYTELLLGADDTVDCGVIQTAAKNTSFTTKKLALQPNGGNVGIGTTSPSAKFHVSGSGDIVSLVETASNAFAQYQLKSGSTNSWVLGTQSTFLSNALVFRNGSDKMVLTTDGVLGIGLTNPSSSAILHLKSNSKGFLPPTMTTSERNSIGGPENGLVIYNTDSETIDVFTTGGGWKSLSY